MPVSPARTKKALQELAKVFNRLASELTADLNAAINEIDGLKREVQRLKSGTKANRISSEKKSAGSKTNRAHATKRSSSSTTHQAKIHETSHDIKPTGEFVFPHDPSNPSPPPEPALPGNN